MPAGLYTVTVAVGDAGTAVDSVHWANVEDQNAIAGFVPTATIKHATATRTVRVTDGRLTLSPAGGTNTKFDYVDIASVPGVRRHPGRAHQHPGQRRHRRLDHRQRGRGPGAAQRRRRAGLAHQLDGHPDPAQPTARRCRPTRSPAAAATWSTCPRPRRWPRTPRTASAVTTGVQGRHRQGVRAVLRSSSPPAAARSPAGRRRSTRPSAWPPAASFTSVVKGPDGRLYAGTLDGRIYRFPINADGTLGTRDGDPVRCGPTPPPWACPARRPARSSGWRSTRRRRRPPRSSGSPTTTSTSGRSTCPTGPGRIGRLTGPDLGTYTPVVVRSAPLGEGPRDQLAGLRAGRRALPDPGREQRDGRRRLDLGQPARAPAHARRCCGWTRPGCRRRCRWTSRPRRAGPTTRTRRPRR